ncbi:bifunctional folylpolyglutamate synthase/dihydrofolate synthase [Clostridium tarantellae]|uniref:Dihydrofolate synthase/folylpolyglutamate synthase n=1 Tax=Clostridium tarantellae TaxID=39493 RepID=A0A6I1MTN8_9CLOT|nr:folylpolyglutamate synthase/dihydrofolate synthase family protein [Clostridium tarantellae]MPQ44241.1 bifunctional folylpolyglutamate synthase/dihydrofolate synthase [Clostridium tarantellae]
MNYNEAIAYIENTSKFGMNFGLERIEKILELLDNPQKKIKCIHVGGTNGKGSTTAMIASILKEAGYKVGMYTSPYIEFFEERIQINNKNISKDDLIDALEKVKNVIDKVIKLGYDNPTQFEIITAIMFYYFAKENVDYAIIEVGLGGRLDATNVINPLLVVLTSISYDHMNILGNTIEEITFEKCGIIKRGCMVVSYPQQDNVFEIINKKCIDTKSNLYLVSENSLKSLSINKDSFIQEITINILEEKFNLNLPLLGEHQINNCLVAVTAIMTLRNLGLNVDDNSIINGIRKVKWIGRMEVLSKDPLIVIDGAHNIDGIKKLSNSLSKYFNYNKLNLIIGMLGDKQVDEMVNEIIKYSSNIIVTEPHNHRAENINSLYNKILSKNKKCFAIEQYEEALKKGINLLGNEDMLLISGSLYMIGDMRKIIKKYYN